MFLSFLRKSCKFFPSSVKSRVVPLSFNFELEILCWDKVATWFWSHVIQIIASILFTATIMSMNSSSMLPTEGGSGLVIHQKKKKKTKNTLASSHNMQSWIIYYFQVMLPTARDPTACGDQSQWGCPVLWDFQWSGLSRYVESSPRYKLYLSLILIFFLLWYELKAITKDLL